MNDHTTRASAQPTQEEWRTIPGFERYEASTHGRIRSVTTTITQQSRQGTTIRRTLGGKILNPYKEKNGYLYVRPRPAPLTRKESVHVLVARTFRGERPPGYDVHHLDGNKTNNRPENLAYVDESNHGREHAKAAHATYYRARLTEADVREIHRLAAGGMTQTNIAIRKGITQAYVSAILLGKAKCWRHVR